MIEVIGISSEPPRPSSQHKGDSFAPERQRTGNKRQRQEIEDEGEGEGNKGGRRDICPGWTKNYLWIEMRQTRPIGEWQFIKIKEEILC